MYKKTELEEILEWNEESSWNRQQETSVMESFVGWNRSHSVKNKILDEQHKGILDFINKLHESYMGDLDINKEETTKFLVKYIHEHLNAEEKMFSATKYPNKSEHIEIHYQFKSKAVELLQNTKELNHYEVLDLLKFLKNWWINHITLVDKQYTSYL